MFAVTIDLDAYDNLPPRQLKAMLRALRFADEGGVVHASLTMLAMPGLSRSSAHRELAGLEAAGHVARQERPEGGFLWRIGRRFRSRKFAHAEPSHRPGSWDAGGSVDNAARGYQADENAGSSVAEHQPISKSRLSYAREGLSTIEALGGPPDGPPGRHGNSHNGTPVPQRGTTDSRAPARLELSSGSKEPLEREHDTSSDDATKLLSLSQDEIPSGWEEAAAAERRLAGLAPVNLPCEWRKLVAYSEGARITIWRWRGWALKARGNAAPPTLGTLPHGVATESVTDRIPISASASKFGLAAGDERQQRQARDWVRTGFWLRGGMWGPAPDQPGCTLPAGLVAWCLTQHAAAAA